MLGSHSSMERNSNNSLLPFPSGFDPFGCNLGSGDSYFLAFAFGDTLLRITVTNAG